MIYLDNAATTRVRGEVLEIMLPFLRDEYGNPSGVYSLARSAHSALDLARERVARVLGAEHPREIFFTGCGTESDNWALCCASGKGGHIVTSKAEHHAVLETCAFLEKHGREVTYIDPDEYGMISPEAVRSAMRENTMLVSIMHANNEVGTINPIADIAGIVHKHGALFHVDAVQSAGHIPVDVRGMDIDMLSISAHKFHAPKGVGALYVKSGISLPSFMHGGAQERGRRAGTEGLPSIAGMGLALELAANEMKDTESRMTVLRDHLINRLLNEIPESRLNGHPSKRLPGNVNISFKNTKAETVLFNLDLMGIAAASGSACTAGAIGVSHVISSMRVPGEYAQGAIRFSLSRYTTLEEIDAAADAVKEIFDNKI